ncbi:sulfatase-like hydrolase/transferase [Nocardioides piscis]|uniref:Sulfatase-like hydrolase/transferase n=1 Tax=Nocardioides piscis TaxID=2714938 RepID=A0A6G7YEK9_9ACTN|nr:sulfatase-like hydrolase/transferase [Nocardioides piscis]QIK75047.1 sulfatase-like hydrolase/transferase [Nocardioides piscis]
MQFVRRGVAALCLLALTACGAAAGVSGDEGPLVLTADARQQADEPSVVPAVAVPRAEAAARPNIVLVLMDDFSLDLVQTMRSMRQMRRRGADYSHAFVVDSLCCVSRASLFTGQYPHQTGVRTNTSGTAPGSPLGGWPAFQGYGNPERAFNVALQQAGYTTGFVGKYLNEYEWSPGRAAPPALPGWSELNVVFGSAYDGWGYASTYLSGGQLRIREHAAPPASASPAVRDRAYAGAMIERTALSFIKRHQPGAAPYFLEVSAYAPHNRTQPQPHYPGDPVFPPMFRDRPRAGKPGNCGPVACADLTRRDLPGFGDDRRDNRPLTRKGKPSRAWNTRPNPFRAAVSINDLRTRAMMAQSVDRTVRKILRAVDDNTYVVFTSDNGFHLGQNGLGRGKGTAYDTDVHVPLYVVGPGVKKGTRAELTSNIDLAPTFEELAGLTPRPYRFGASLVPTFGDPTLVRRNHVFIEHTAQALTKADPDSALRGDELDRIPSYVAVRSRTGVLIRYDFDNAADRVVHGYEFYPYKNRVWEKTNSFAMPRYRAEVSGLLAKLEAFDDCSGQSGSDPVRGGCRDITR